MSFAVIAIGTGLALTAGAAVYATSSQNNIAGQELGLANTQAGKQNQAYSQLQQLISDPSSFFGSPVYTAAANQGGAQVARQTSAQFGPNSGNEAQALQAYGQTFGQQQLLSQEQLLAGMSGTGYNPAGALGGASSAVGSASGSLASLGGLLAFFGSSGGAGLGSLGAGVGSVDLTGSALAATAPAADASTISGLVSTLG
jgi:hypothetical protein